MPSALAILLQRSAWVAFLACTGWLALGLPDQGVDAQNRSLKSPTSRDAERLRELAAVVPSDPVVLVAFTAPGDLELPADQRRQIDGLVEQVRALPGVASIANAPVPDPGLAAYAVTVAHDDELPTTERVLAACRAGLPPGVGLHAAGLPLVEGTIARLVAAERQRVVPLLLAVLFAVAWVAYRRAALAAAALAPALAAIAWTSGALARLGHRLDPVAALLDPVLLTIGVATSVHVVGAFLRATAAGLPAAAAVDAAVREVKAPALLATATTMVGMWSLASSDIPAVFDFGLRSALGIGLAHFFTFLLLPPLLTRMATPGPATAAASTHPLADRLWAAIGRHRTGALAAAAALSALAAAGLFRVRADNDVLQLLPPDELVRRDHDALAGRLGGVEAFHLLVPARHPGAAPARLLPLLAALREQPGIAGLAGQAQRGEDGEVAVPLLLAPGGSASREALFAGIERTTTVLGFDDVAPAGPSVQLARDSGRLLRSLLGSGLGSLAVLAIGMAVGLRSWRLGLLGIAPNLLPSLWLYGALGWSGRPVSVATAMIGCTMLGLVVDNTIHLLHRYHALRSRADAASALAGAWQDTIRPMTLASVVLALGFGSAAWSRLTTTAEFGVLAAATIATAWMATAVLLPASLRPPRTAEAMA
ncbi:MAG: MMPL family transporter [Planctomycetota bacterium]